MKAILNTLKTLSTSSTRAQWADAESQLLGSLKQFDKEAFVQAATHFGNASQGSQDFWRQVQAATIKNLNTFDSNQIAELALAIGSSAEAIDPKVEATLLKALDTVVDQEIENLKRKDPYWEADFNAYLDSGLAPVMKWAASMQATRNLDKTRYPTEQDEAPVLVEFHDSFQNLQDFAGKETGVQGGDAKKIEIAEDGKIVLDEELQAELKEYTKQFERELEQNSSNEKVNLWSLFKWK